MSSNYDQIRADNIREYGQGTRHISILGSLYSDRTHFIFELLQNAEDAGATKILFVLSQEELEVRHDGRPFNENDVRGICGVGEGTKADDLTQIGKYGIGFKSVFVYTSSPEVHSGDEHFRIENYVRPYPATPKETENSWTTLFVLCFNANSIDASTAYREIAARLNNLNARTLLFLRSINEIEYRLDEETSGVYLREEVSRKHCRQVTVIGQNNGGDLNEDWLIFEKSIDRPDIACSVKVEIGFRLKKDDKTGAEQVTRTKDTSLVVYFPTEKPTGFGFIMQGPYRTTKSRDNIPEDDEWNKYLINETANLLSDALLNLKEMDLLTVTLLETLPIRMDDFSEAGMFYPVVSRVRETLINEKLLPTDDGAFVSARNARLASVEWLRTLLQDQQIQQLFGSENTLKWISREITESNHDLWNYIKEELKVKVETPDSFARKIEGSFLEKQTDDWMIAFYHQLASQKALWRKGAGYSLPEGPLRSKPFIRLERGSHVKPFRNDQSPNAYLPVEARTESSLPIVKSGLCQKEIIYLFLKELGIPELDLVAEVIEMILPKYTAASPSVAFDENLLDIVIIERARATDSQEKKKQLLEQLQSTAFILVEDSTSGNRCYRKPNDVYLKSNELVMYFAGSKAFAYASYMDNKSAVNLFKAIGVNETVRIQRRVSDERGYVPIKNRHSRHKRGLKSFDPDISVDGLEWAIANPTLERSEFIWNNIVVQNSSCIRGIIETSKRQSFELSKKVRQISSFGQLLIDNAWLPGPDDKMYKPSELSLDDLPESYERDERAANQLCMIKNTVTSLAEEAGVSTEDISLAQQINNSRPDVRSKIESLLNQEPDKSNESGSTLETSSAVLDYQEELEQSFNKTGRTEISNQMSDEGNVVNAERRRDGTYNEHKNRLQNEPSAEKRRKKSIRTILEGPDGQVREYLYQMYRGKCQICGTTFPERDGRPFFVSNYIVPRKTARAIDTPANALCFCADHFAKWQHGAIESDDILDQIRNFKTKSEGGGVPATLMIRLCGEELEIKFTEKHLLDLQELLSTSKGQ